MMPKSKFEKTRSVKLIRAWPQRWLMLADAEQAGV
jgi:hypothetical protein